MTAIRNLLIQLVILMIFLIFNAWLIQITWSVFFTEYLATPPLKTVMGGLLMYTLIFHKPDWYFHEKVAKDPKLAVAYLTEGLKMDFLAMCLVGLFHLT